MAKDARGVAFVRAAGWRAAYRGLLPDHLLDDMDIDAWSGRAAGWLDDPSGPGRNWVAEEGGRVLGWSCCFLPGRDADLPMTTAELVALYLDPEVWGRGLGKALLNLAVDDSSRRGALEMSLWVLTGNQRARTFYERSGFALGTAPPKVLLGSDATSVRYRKMLTDPV